MYLHHYNIKNLTLAAMKKLLFTCIILCFLQNSYSQNTLNTNKTSTPKKDNPILFLDVLVGFGGAFNEFSGFDAGVSANYQNENNLYTFRYNHIEEIKTKVIQIGYGAVPVFATDHTNDEYALLYGKRYIFNNTAVSFSGGPGLYSYTQNLEDNTGDIYEKTSSHISFAYEITIKWFKGKRKPYRIYNIIPVSKPTSFGHGIGFKLVGNFSKYSYIGFGLSYGWGWHKKY